MRTLFAVISSHKTWARVQAIRDTWAQNVKGADLLFFRATPRPDLCPIGDVVELPVPDDYTNLALKVQAMFDWASTFYDLIWKLDDDVYAVPDLLLKVPKEHYVGRFRHPSDVYPAEYASGFAYRLSRNAAALVGKAKYNGDWAEDRFVGNVLAANNIRGMQLGNFLVAVTPPLQPEVIFRTNAKISGAFCEAPNKEWMHDMHRYHTRLIMPELNKIPLPKMEPITYKKVTLEQIACPPL